MMRLLVTPVLSAPAVQASPTDVGLLATPLSDVGAVGGAMSTVQVAVAGDDSVTPPAVAATVNLWLPAASPV